MPKQIDFELSPEDRSKLESWMRGDKTEQRLVRRAQIVLMSVDGAAPHDFADRLGVRRPFVSKWRLRFAAGGIGGLFHGARRGRPKRHTAETRKRILAALDVKPPSGYARWNRRLLAERLGEVPADHVWQVPREEGIHLQRQSLQGASFRSARQLRKAVDDFVLSCNAKAAPFKWRKRTVHQKGFASSYSNLYK